MYGTFYKWRRDFFKKVTMVSLLCYRRSFCVNIKASVLVIILYSVECVTNCQLAPICESPLSVTCPYMQGNVTNHGHSIEDFNRYKQGTSQFMCPKKVVKRREICSCRRIFWDAIFSKTSVNNTN